jgi:hypothetical protein
MDTGIPRLIILFSAKTALLSISVFQRGDFTGLGHGYHGLAMDRNYVRGPVCDRPNIERCAGRRARRAPCLSPQVHTFHSGVAHLRLRADHVDPDRRPDRARHRRVAAGAVLAVTASARVSGQHRSREGNRIVAQSGGRARRGPLADGVLIIMFDWRSTCS